MQQHVRVQRYNVCRNLAPLGVWRLTWRRGDTIPHVIAFIFPSLEESFAFSWLVHRNAVIMLITFAVSFPLSLHRDIVKLSKSSGFGPFPSSGYE